MLHSSRFTRLSKLTISRSISSAEIKETNKYCMNLVQTHDHDNYLIGLLFPKQYRDAYFAIRAFNCEIAMIKDQIPRNTYHAGSIRFQFWRDLLVQIDSNKSGDENNTISINQPVALSLDYHVRKHNLTVRWLERSLEARFKDAMSTTSEFMFDKMDELEDFAEYGHSSILYSLLELLEIKGDQNLEFATSHVGVCSGILTLLRGYSYHAQQGICYIPQDILVKHSLPPVVALKGPNSDDDLKALKNATNDVASQAYAHLNQARILQDKFISSNSSYILLPAVRSTLFLEELKKKDFDPFLVSLEEQQQKSHLNFQSKLIWYNFWKRI